MEINDIIFALMIIVIVLNVTQSAQIAKLNEQIASCPVCTHRREQ